MRKRFTVCGLIGGLQKCLHVGLIINLLMADYNYGLKAHYM